jgi:hypothetical protein
MTANQLKYWELRWKQFYEFHYLKEQHRANVAKETETERHNRATERVARQQLVLDRIRLSNEQEKINIEWQKLALSQRAQLVHEVVEQRKLDIEEKDYQLKVDQFLANIKVATAELISDVQHNINQDRSAAITANAKAFGDGWLEGSAAKAAAWLETLSGTKNYENIVNTLVDDLNTSIPGLKVEKPKFKTDAPDVQEGSVSSVIGTSKADKLATEIYGPDATQRSKFGSRWVDNQKSQNKHAASQVIQAGVKGPGNDTESVSGVQTSTGATNHDTGSAPKSKVSGVIYSGSANVGPGWR